MIWIIRPTLKGKGGERKVELDTEDSFTVAEALFGHDCILREVDGITTVSCPDGRIFTIQTL